MAGTTWREEDGVHGPAIPALLDGVEYVDALQAEAKAARRGERATRSLADVTAELGLD